MIKKIQYLGISIILLFCSWFHLPAGQIELIKQVSLDDLGILKPTLIKAHLGKIYIYDDGGKSFFIINNDLKVIKKFGKTGLGPGEYRTPLGFGFFNDCLWLMDTYGKKINYDLNGKFIGEK
ncbi:MAG: 6-bladed beta-propeller, partial [Acidobacteria bacterium]|nr:6-bladed beta-propeller [Acidobacteriota bacterium]